MGIWEFGRMNLKIDPPGFENLEALRMVAATPHVGQTKLKCAVCKLAAIEEVRPMVVN